MSVYFPTNITSVYLDCVCDKQQESVCTRPATLKTKRRAMLLTDDTSNPFLLSQVFSIIPKVISSSIINMDFIILSFASFNATKVRGFGRK